MNKPTRIQLETPMDVAAQIVALRGSEPKQTALDLLNELSTVPIAEGCTLHSRAEFAFSIAENSDDPEMTAQASLRVLRKEAVDSARNARESADFHQKYPRDIYSQDFVDRERCAAKDYEAVVDSITNIIGE